MFRTSARRLSQVARPGQLFHTSHAPMAAATEISGDKILLKGLVFHGYHGVLEEERSLGQKFIINATLTTNLQKAGKSDDLHDTINYAAVYTDIKAIVEGKPHLLIESVAETIAKKILESHETVEDQPQDSHAAEDLDEQLQTCTDDVDEADNHPIKLLDFLMLIIEDLQRKDTFDHREIKKLRTVSKEIKSYLQSALPIEALKMYGDEIDDLPLHPSFTEGVKRVIIDDPIYTNTAISLVNSPFPKLQELTLEHNLGTSEILPWALPSFPSLTFLDLSDFYDGENYEFHLAFSQVPLPFLKEFRYYSQGDSLAPALANMKSLTKLVLTMHRNPFDWHQPGLFLEDSLENLEDLTICVERIEDRLPYNFAIAPPLPKLKRFTLKESAPLATILILYGMADMPSFIQHLESLSIEFKEPDRYRMSHIPPLPRFLPALANAGCIKEISILNWDPEILSFQELEFPSLVTLKLPKITSSEGYNDLLAANMPALEILEISKPLGICELLDKNASDEATGELSASLSFPFPSLSTLTWKGDASADDIAVSFLQHFLPSVRKLDIELEHRLIKPAKSDTLNKIFGLGNSLSYRHPLSLTLMPNLFDLKITGSSEYFCISLLKLLPLYCPSLKRLSINPLGSPFSIDFNQEERIHERFKDGLLDAARRGFWCDLESVTYREKTQIWPLSTLWHC